MKKIFPTLLLVFFFSMAFSQKPVKGDKGFVFGLSGLSVLGVETKSLPTGSLGFRYKTSDRMTARFGFSFGSRKLVAKSDTTGNGIDSTTTTKSNHWAINLGLQYSLGKIAKLDPYIGAEIFYGRSDGTFESHTEVVTPVNPNAFGDYATLSTSDFGRGRNVGARVLMGVNYFFADHFALGAEFGFGYESRIAKNGTTTLEIKGTTFGTPGTTYTTNSASAESSDFGPSSSGKIMFSVYF